LRNERRRRDAGRLAGLVFRSDEIETIEQQGRADHRGRSRVASTVEVIESRTIVDVVQNERAVRSRRDITQLFCAEVSKSKAAHQFLAAIRVETIGEYGRVQRARVATFLKLTRNASKFFEACGGRKVEPPDHQRFPSLMLARGAARAGGTAPALLNAANEVAVQAFLDRRLNFTAIATVIDRVLQRLDSSPVKALGDVLDADAAARRLAEALIEPGSGVFA